MPTKRDINLWKSGLDRTYKVRHFFKLDKRIISHNDDFTYGEPDGIGYMSKIDPTELKLPFDNMCLEITVRTTTGKNIPFMLHCQQRGVEIIITPYTLFEKGWQVVPINDGTKQIGFACVILLPDEKGTKVGWMSMQGPLQKNVKGQVMYSTLRGVAMELVEGVGPMAAAVAAMLYSINNHEIIKAQGGSHKRWLNKPDSRGRVNHTIYLSDKAYYEMTLRSNTNTGVKRAPHDRRGHWCTSSKGKVYWRRASQIHGGRREIKEYKVCE